MGQQDAQVVGSLIGQKVVINEFVAYLQLGSIVNGQVDGVTLTEQGRGQHQRELRGRTRLTVGQEGCPHVRSP